MGLFNNREKKEPQPRNMQTTLMIRLLAIGYVLYMLYKIVTAYVAGGEDAPALWLLILSIVVLGGGSVGVGILTWKDYKAHKEAEAEQLALAEEEETEEEAQEESDDTL